MTRVRPYASRLERFVPASPFVRWAMLASAIAVVLFLRRPDSLLNPQFWAEDGAIFFRDQLLLGTAAALVHPYAGYVHLVPRLVAAIASAFPPERQPLLYDASALAIAAACCSLFASPAYRFLIRSDAVRAIACVIAAVLPFANELVGTIANVQWYLALAALLLLVHPAERRTTIRTALAAIAIALCVLSAPQTIIFIPIAIVRLWDRRPAGQAMAAMFLICAAVQAAVALSLHTGVTGGPPAREIAAATLVALASQVVLSDVVGHADAELLARAAPLLIPLLPLAALAAVLWPIRTSRRRIVHSGVAIALSVAGIALVMSFRGLASSFTDPAHLTAWRGERYFFLPSCLLVFCALAACLALRGTARAAYAVCLTVMIAFATTQNARIPALPDDRWPVYASRIGAWEAADATRMPALAVTVPINPGWEIQLPGKYGAPPAPATVSAERGTRCDPADRPSRWDGRLVRKAGDTPEDGKVYVVLCGRRHWVTSGAWIARHGYAWPSSVHIVPGDEVDALPLGAPIDDAATRVATAVHATPPAVARERSSSSSPLIRVRGDSAEQGKVYFVQGGVRHWVISADWITRHHLRWPDDVRYVTQRELDAIPIGPPVQ